MAETSLDDFFAKKDKTRKGKKKYSTPDDLAKELEETGKGLEKKREKDKSNNIFNNTTLKILEQNSDEWKDFEDEKEKDYSGLRIQSLSIKDKEEELKEQKLQESSQENKKDASGPWKLNPSDDKTKKSIDEQTGAEFSQAQQEPLHPVKLVKPVKPVKKYIPPQLRAIEEHIPQIDDEEHFPSLCDAKSG